MLFLLTAFSLECDCKITNYFQTGKKNFTGSAEGAVWGTHTNHVFSNIGNISQYNPLKTSNKAPPAPYPLRIPSVSAPNALRGRTGWTGRGCVLIFLPMYTAGISTYLCIFAVCLVSNYLAIHLDT